MGVRIYDRKTGELMLEFSSISKGADYVKSLAFVKLQKKYSNSYIESYISGRSDYFESVMFRLGIRTERSSGCTNECPEQAFGTLCIKCERWGPQTKSLIQGKYYYVRVGEVMGPTDSDTDNDGKLKCESCGNYSDDVIFQDDKCQACEVEFAEDPFGMFRR